ncbi:Ceramide kinase [Taenia crassiceps]|uniref:Ceramide kinase n=1 Tax=Taenia crassiceps TaxID=6207 RepID=A0ABR4QNS4_9CEST
MAAGDSHTGTNVHDLTVNEHYITWKWTPLVMGSFSSRRVNSKAAVPENFYSGLWKVQTWNAIGPTVEISSYYRLIKLYRELSTPRRPRSLLVFINPYGGKKHAETIFYSTVRPIFELAGIDAKVIVTTHQGHCQNFMLKEDLHSYDGVVAVGGDGFFAELLHGLLYRTRADAKLPLYRQHKPFSLEVTPQLRIGLIPAGSTNAVIRSIHGTEDVETAAIHIALGLDVGVDVLGIHDSSTKAFLRYTVSLLGYGFHGDILEPSEQLRWLGPARYDVAGAFKWLKLASYKCRIAYLPSSSSTPFDKNTCGPLCPVCLKFDRGHGEATKAPRLATQLRPITSSLVDIPVLGSQSLRICSSAPSFSQNKSNMEGVPVEGNDLPLGPTEVGEGGEESRIEEKKLTSGWRVTIGDFVAVNAFLISCRCAKSPLGPAPSAHLGDGFLDLILVRRCSRMQYLRYLVQLTNRHRKRQAQHLRIPFVEAHRVRAFHLQALDRYGHPVATDEAMGADTSVWCVDGEVLRNSNIICCVHRQLIRMYGRGPEM